MPRSFDDRPKKFNREPVAEGRTYVRPESKQRNRNARSASTVAAGPAEPMRLQKYLSVCGFCSRRHGELMIERGEITVNGEPATLGMKVEPGDRVEAGGRLITPGDERKLYIMLNKPRGFVTTLEDELGRRSVADLVADIRTRVVPVGRLDRESEGLLLLSNDGDFVYRMTHPKHNVEKRYLVCVGGLPSSEVIKKLNEPMEIDGYQCDPVEVVILEKREDRTVLRFSLHEGRNRQIRRMCEIVGLEVLRLKRVAYGDLRLAGVKPGKWRMLTPEEVSYLNSL